MLETLAHDFLRVTESAAIASARTMGQGDAHRADDAAVAAMRRTLGEMDMRGRIVIGEGERDEAPMLYIGENVGRGSASLPEIDIAVDPLEGTNLCATGAPNAIAVLAASGRGGLLHAPDVYMEKLVVGPSSKGRVDLDVSVADNLEAIAGSLGRRVEDLVVVVLDRPRHQKLIADIRRTGARIKLISDGDVSAGIHAAVRGSGVHALMGVGGAPEGVLTAAAMRCLNGEILGRLQGLEGTSAERLKEMGIRDPRKVYRTEELAPGAEIVFVATGVTTGELIRGAQFFGDGTRTQSLVMSTKPHYVRFVDTIHVAEGERLPIRL